MGPDYGGRTVLTQCAVWRSCGGCAAGVPSCTRSERAQSVHGACSERARSVRCARSGAGCGGTLKLRKLRLPAQEYRRCRGRLTGSGTAAGAVAATDGGPVGAGVRHACWLGDAGTD